MNAKNAAANKRRHEGNDSQAALSKILMDSIPWVLDVFSE
jgi:hypothetical protein